MKKANILYWVFTLLIMIPVFLGAIPDLISSKDAADIFVKIGFPAYMMPFLGAAKMLGVIAILIPGNFPRIKEWAYAGIFFDLLGAFYAGYCSTHGDPKTFFMFLFIIPLFISYYFYHRRLKVKAAQSNSLR